MLVASSVRNQKEHRNRRNHMNALLEEIKVKANIEGLDLEKKIYGSISEAILIERKNRQKSREQRLTKEPHEFMKWQKKSPKNKKSRASMKLEEIVKYAEQFPHPNLKRLMESRGSVEFQKLTDTKRAPSKFQHRRRCGFIFKDDENNLTQPKINYELMLKFDMNNEILETECHTQDNTRVKESQREERMKYLIELNKQHNSREKDFSMKGFIEDGIEKELKRANRMERRTHNDNIKQINFIVSPEEKTQSIDLRDERMERIHKFIRGCSQQEKEEFSEYIGMSEIKKNIQNFKTYENIYKKIKYSLNKEKMNPKLFREQSMRNVIYLTENLKQEGNMERKREIKLAMKRLKIAE